MFSANQFYPTPDDLIHKMIIGLPEDPKWWSSRSMLEPSAGKGNICNYLVRLRRLRKNQIMVIESDPDLQATLVGMDYPLVHTDFLQYGGGEHFDLIVMNPPFAGGAKHLLKAWDVIAGDGHIACILNAETLRNPHTGERQQLSRIIDEHGRYEIVPDAFRDAERRASVDVAIIWLHKPDDGQGFNFNPDGLHVDGRVADDDTPQAPLAERNMIRAVVAQYNAALSALKERHRANVQLRYYTEGLHGLYRMTTLEHDKLQDEIKALKGAFWDLMFRRTQLANLATKRVRQDIDQMLARAAALAFDEHNVYEVMSMLLVNKDDIMIQCMRDIFKSATSYHDKNVVHTEGWKTNKAWKINEKIIVPNGVRYDPRWGGSWSLLGQYTNLDFFADVDKAICFIRGEDHEALRLADHTLRDQRPPRFSDVPEHNLIIGAIGFHLRTTIQCTKDASYDTWFESRWFRIRVFKKGTVHIVWKDKEILNTFNRIAAENRAWLPDRS